MVERLGLPSTAIERQHRQLVHPFPGAVLVGEGERFGERLRVTAEREPRLEALLQRQQSQLVQALAFAPRELLVCELPESPAAPQRQRLLRERDSECRVAVAASRAALTEQPLEPRCIETVLWKTKRVTPTNRLNDDALW